MSVDVGAVPGFGVDPEGGEGFGLKGVAAGDDVDGGVVVGVEGDTANAVELAQGPLWR